MNESQIKKNVLTAVFAALSIVVGFFEIPWIPPYSFLKIDFSEVIVLISLLMLGFPRTVVVIVIRSLVREFTGIKPFEPIPYLGEIMAILGSLVIITTYKLLFMRKKHRKDEVICGSFCDNEPLYKIIIKVIILVSIFSVFMTGVNYFVTAPIQFSGLKHYFITSFLKDPNYNFTFTTYTTTILSMFLPFNFVKGILVMIVFKTIDRLLSKNNIYDSIYKKEDLKEDKDYRWNKTKMEYNLNGMTNKN